MSNLRNVIPSIATAISFIFALAACNTIEGVGKDIKKGGEVITGAADKASRSGVPASFFGRGPAPSAWK